MTALLLTIALFGFIVFCHEFGHLVASAIVGASVREFSFGFGPRLWSCSLRIGRIEDPVQVSLRPIPLGAYVRYGSASDGEGPDGEAEHREEGEGRGEEASFAGTAPSGLLARFRRSVSRLPDPFREIAPWKKVVIALAGPLGSIAAMFILYSTALLLWGNPPSSEMPDQRIGAFQVYEPSLSAALQATEDPSLVTRAAAGQDEPMPLASPEVNWEPVGPMEAASRSATATAEASMIIGDMVLWLASQPEVVVESLAGPVGMVSWGARAARTSRPLPEEEQRRWTVLEYSELADPPEIDLPDERDQAAEDPESEPDDEPYEVVEAPGEEPESEPETAEDDAPSPDEDFAEEDVDPEEPDPDEEVPEPEVVAEEEGEEGVGEEEADPEEAEAPGTPSDELTVEGALEVDDTDPEPSLGTPDETADRTEALLEIYLPHLSELRGHALLFLYMGALSIVLAVVNLLPIPPLDGFQALVASAELVSRRRLPSRWRAYLSVSGALFLLLLVAIGTVNDVGRLLD